MSNAHCAQVQSELLNVGDRVEYAEGVATVTSKSCYKIVSSRFVAVGLEFDNGQLGQAEYRSTDMVALHA